MKKYLFVILVSVSFMFTSCVTKQGAINQLEQFSYELRDHSAEYDLQEWKDAVNKFGKIRSNINKHKNYTVAERQRIGELEGQCAGYMAKGAKDGVVNKVMGLGGELKGILEGILNSVTE